MKNKELEFFYPYLIEKKHNFRHKMKNVDAFYDEMMGKNEYFYKDEGNYGYRRNTDHFTEEEYTRNDFILTEFRNWRSWFENGRNIFDFSYELLELLNETDVLDVTYESFKLPYDYFYLSLKPLEIKVADDSKKIIEGVYILIERQAMEVNHYPEEDPNLPYDFAISFHFVGDFEEIKLRNFDKIWDGYGSGAGGVEFWNYSFFFLRKENVITIQDGINDAKDMFKSQYFPENSEEVSDIHLDALNYHKNFIDRTAPVLINALLYLSLPKEKKDIITDYPINLPHNFNKKLSFSKTESDKRKIVKKINETGFSKIQFVGNSFKKQNYSDQKQNSSSPHWRRGHWRNQLYGVGLEKSKLVWIKPTIVNKELGKPQKGHIYEVE